MDHVNKMLKSEEINVETNKIVKNIMANKDVFGLKDLSNVSSYIKYVIYANTAANKIDKDFKNKISSINSLRGFDYKQEQVHSMNLSELLSIRKIFGDILTKINKFTDKDFKNLNKSSKVVVGSNNLEKILKKDSNSNVIKSIQTENLEFYK